MNFYTKKNFFKLKFYKNKDQKGFVTFMATLLVVAIGLSISISLLILGVDSSRTSLVTIQLYQSSALANACAEEALQKIYESMAVTSPPDPIPFVGTGSLSLGQGSCFYSVTDTGGGTMDILTSGTVGSVVRKNQVILSSVSPISVSSWQEIQ